VPVIIKLVSQSKYIQIFFNQENNNLLIQHENPHNTSFKTVTKEHINSLQAQQEVTLHDCPYKSNQIQNSI
jgi:hypothetical protein